MRNTRMTYCSAQWRDQSIFILVSYERASSTAPWQEARRGNHENQVDLVPTSVAKDAALAHCGTTGGKSSSHWVALPNEKRSLNTWTLVLNCVQQKVRNHPGHLQGGQVEILDHKSKSRLWSPTIGSL